MKASSLAGVAARSEGREANAELGTITARADFRYPLRREQTFAIDLATVQHQLPEPPEINQTCRK